MPGLDRRFRWRASARPRGPSADELIIRAKQLIDTPRPPDGYSLGWCVAAEHLGDLNAIAIAAIRAEPDQPTDDSRV